MKQTLFLLLVLNISISNAQYTQQSNIYPANITDGDEFGSAVDINEDWLAVGAFYFNSSSSSPGYGSVFLWERSGSTWTYNSQILPTDNPYNGDQFGNAIAISGNDIIIGSWNSSTDGDLNPGAVYFYQFDGTSWTNETKFLSGINDYDIGYGTSVDIFGDYAIVGAPGVSSNKGAAYLYSKTSGVWQFETSLIGSNSNDDYFGASVTIENEIAFVGAKGEQKVYVFNFDGTNWNQTSTISPSGSSVSFGNSINFDGTNLIIGDEGDNCAYIFNFDGTNWNQQKITSSDVSLNDHFGCNVSISGNFAVVGAWSKNSMEGASYVFKNTGGVWAQSQKLTASNGDSNDRFGKSVSIENSDIIIGAYYDNPDGIGTYSGSAYIFSSPPILAPEITSNPQSIDICEGSVAVFNISANNVNNYQWYNSSGALSDGGDISGVTTNQLSISNSEQADEDDYYCIVSGDGGSLQSNNASLVVDLLIVADAGLEQSVCTNNTFLSANNPIPGNGLWSVLSGNGFFVNASNYNTEVTNLASGENVFRWTITNGECVSEDDLIIFRNLPVTILSHPVSVNANEGETVQFSASISGNINSVQWQKNNFDLNDDENITGTNTNTINITNVSTFNEGTYHLVVNGICNNITTNDATLGVVAGVENLNMENTIFFPNPASNTLHFFKLNTSNFEIIDILGIKHPVSLNKVMNSINISNLQNGIYFIRYTDGTKTKLVRFIKE